MARTASSLELPEKWPWVVHFGGDFLLLLRRMSEVLDVFAGFERSVDELDYAGDGAYGGQGFCHEGREQGAKHELKSPQGQQTFPSACYAGLGRNSPKVGNFRILPHSNLDRKMIQTRKERLDARELTTAIFVIQEGRYILTKKYCQTANENEAVGALGCSGPEVDIHRLPPTHIGATSKGIISSVTIRRETPSRMNIGYTEVMSTFAWTAIFEQLLRRFGAQIWTNYVATEG
ncbi:hypothetical protein DFH09DRAFT_1277117 [Mycena vulgaris]|nr:hypothetical protein DFH09DRAFT_1277117 [Mycena vulgaris]